jgi:oligoendopeptidase F
MDGEEANAKLEELQAEPKKINGTYRPKFENLTGQALLGYIRDTENFSRSLEILYSYAYSKNSLNVSDPSFESLLSRSQDLYTNLTLATSFADVKLTSLSADQWHNIFQDEPGLEPYRPYLEQNYMRFIDHRPKDEAQAARLAEIENRRMKLETAAEKEITNNVTIAGNITLKNCEEFAVNYPSYLDLLSSDGDRDNRKMCYDKFFYHLKNSSESMAAIYLDKTRLDEQLARELNYSDSYQKRLFEVYLTEGQISQMNEVFKERKGVFDPYYEFRKKKMGLESLRPYDQYLQLASDPGKKTNYSDALLELEGQFSGMDRAFDQILTMTATGGYIDVYPNADGGKQIGGYCLPMYAVRKPSLIFLNYRGTIDDKSTLAHEMGHAINSYLMGENLDYLYCNIPEYEAEVASTFNEELFLDYAVQNYDKDAAVAVLADHIRTYESLFMSQTMYTEFERKAHQYCLGRDKVTGVELSAIWTDLAKEYRSDKVDWYDDDDAKWAYVSHLYFTNNYYTFSYALSEAITLALFKQYQDDPVKFNKNYVAYLSTGTTMTPPEKLRKYFGLEIDKKLFEDAMDIVEMRVKQMDALEKRQA